MCSSDLPVLCEKPLATREPEARQIIDAEVTLGERLIQVGFMRQYDPAHVAVKQISDRGDNGKALVFRSVHINPYKDEVRSIDDIITNSVIHDIHSARWIMDDEIESVYTSYIPFVPSQPKSARYVMTQLQFRNGAIGGLECNAEAGYGYEVNVRITGETGVVQTNSLQSPIVRYNNVLGQRIENDWLQRFEVAYINEAQAWVQSIIDGEATGPSAWDGYVSILVADACIRSAKRGQPVWVHVPEKPDLYT